MAEVEAGYEKPVESDCDEVKAALITHRPENLHAVSTVENDTVGVQCDVFCRVWVKRMADMGYEFVAVAQYSTHERPWVMWRRRISAARPAKPAEERKEKPAADVTELSFSEFRQKIATGTRESDV